MIVLPPTFTSMTPLRSLAQIAAQCETSLPSPEKGTSSDLAILARAGILIVPNGGTLKVQVALGARADAGTVVDFNPENYEL
jgi:hypothetical protein